MTKDDFHHRSEGLSRKLERAAITDTVPHIPMIIMRPPLYEVFVEVRRERNRESIDTPVGWFNDYAEALYRYSKIRNQKKRP